MNSLQQHRTHQHLLFSTLAFVLALIIIYSLALLLDRQQYVPLASLTVLAVWSASTSLGLAKLIKKRGRLLVAATLLLSIVLTVFTTWFSFVGFMLVNYGVIILILTLSLFLVQRLLKKRVSTTWILLSSTVILSGSLAVLLGGFFATPTPLIQDETAGLTLNHLYNTDQEDRFSGYWIFNPKRDQQRLAYVLERIASDDPLTAEEMYFAAYLLQHGSCVDHYRMANELATEAAKSNVEGAERLAQSSYDRWQLALGNQQQYGTQQIPIPIKRPCV